MSKFKVGDRVRMSAKGRDRFQEERCNPYNIEGTIVAFDPEDDDLEWRVEWDNRELNWYASNNIELATPTHTLTPDQTYTSANGNKWECIFVRDGKAWLVGVYEGKAEGSAYDFDVDGTASWVIESDRAPYNIVFEPVREDTRTRLYYSTMYGFEVADDGARADVILEIPFIDGKLDCTQAKVTPCE